MLVATDFSTASRQALDVAMKVAPQAGIDLLHVYGIWGESRLSMAGAGPQDRCDYRRQVEDSAAAMMREWSAGLDLQGRQFSPHVRQGHPATVITQVAGERQADLVVMGTTGRSGLPYILLGSVAEQVLHSVPCDTLIVRPQGFRFELP
jgi:nucleotide-binding universal stress UspA family protein